MRTIRQVSLLALLFLLAGCASLGSFTGRVAQGYSALTVTNDTAAVLVNAGTITKEDGRKVLEQTTGAREALDMALAVRGQVGEDWLQTALGLLQEAQDALCKDRPTDPNCAYLRSRTAP
jgi:hypothetical protein